MSDEDMGVQIPPSAEVNCYIVKLLNCYTILLCKINKGCIAQMIADEKKQMIADICDDICDHLVSFNLC